MQLDQFSYLTQQGGLREFWYPLMFAEKLRLGKPCRRVALGVPILLWRCDDGVRGFIDSCPHRQAPLSSGRITENGVVCPYHGWRFGSDGHCNFIPTLPEDAPVSQNIAITSIPVCIRNGMVWAWFGEKAEKAPPDEWADQAEKQGWQFMRIERTFHAEVEDLVENFMDSSHTSFVHPGLIRGISERIEREITVETGENFVCIDHAPSDEKVGLFSRLINREGDPVRHSDTFQAPSNVRVDYRFGEQPEKFFAFLGMTPISESSTRILLTIGIRLGWLNPFARLVIPLIGNKVLKQDEHILNLQTKNLSLTNQRNMKSTGHDSADLRVRALRNHLKDPQMPRPRIGEVKMTMSL